MGDSVVVKLVGFLYLIISSLVHTHHSPVPEVGDNPVTYPVIELILI
jgi:hypothetical protein